MERMENDPEESERAMFGKADGHWNCCFFFPCFRSFGGDSSSVAGSSGKWWKKVLAPVTKVREWSELVAGPRWKTFIRRFNHQSQRSRVQRFNYDPLSYALNFDDGIHEDDDDDPDRSNANLPPALHRGFSARFAAVPPPFASGEAPNR